MNKSFFDWWSMEGLPLTAVSAAVTMILFGSFFMMILAGILSAFFGYAIRCKK